MMMNNSNHPATKEYRQLLRRTETPSERMLWKYLRGKQLDGYRFRQQHGFGPYVLDFYCPSIRLCIELDGHVHDSVEAQKKDKERSEYLNYYQIHVIRFRNEEVEQEIQMVLKKIREFINNIINPKTVVQTPNPLT
ncbi:MAG: DUF559 domain-containing protein [Prevotella sp.]|nr:DUF559 domain-containing protein [Prevotella sp.]